MRRLCRTIVATAGLSLTVNAAEPAAAAFVTVDFTNVVRAVKPMHAVNNGPTVKKPGGDQKCGNFEGYKALRIPFARQAAGRRQLPAGRVRAGARLPRVGRRRRKGRA